MAIDIPLTHGRGRSTWFRISKTNRLLIWTMVLLLTALILVLPRQLTNQDYHAIASAHVVQNLPVFLAVFVSWTMLILLLFFSKGRHVLDWEGLILSSIFAFVFIGFWTIVTPLGKGDMESNLAGIKVLFEDGKIASLTHHNLTGFDFPGIYFAIDFFAKVMNVSILAAANILLILVDVLIGAMLYYLFATMLGDGRLGGLATMIALMGNQILVGMYSFHIMLAMPAYLTFLIMLSRGEKVGPRRADFLLQIVLLTSATMTHFVTSTLFFFTLLGRHLLHIRSRQGFFLLPILMISLVIPIAYEAYWAVRTFGMLADIVPKAFNDFTSLGALSSVLQLSGPNLGGSVPVWATLTRLFWWVFLYGFGVLLACLWLLKPSKRWPFGALDVAGLMGVVMLSALAITSSSKGNQFHRFILYGSLFATPIVLACLGSISRQWSRFLWPALVLLPFLAFSSFLVNNATVAIAAFYPHEESVGQFLSTAMGYKGNNAILYTPSIESGAKTAYYYVPDAVFDNPPLFTKMKDQAGVWEELGKILANFKRSTEAYEAMALQRRPFYMNELGLRVTYEHLYGIDPESLEWKKIERRLDEEFNRIYDSSFAQLYTSS